MGTEWRFGSSASHRHARDMSAVLLIAAELMRNSNLSRLANRRRFRFDERTTGTSALRSFSWLLKIRLRPDEGNLRYATRLASSL